MAHEINTPLGVSITASSQLGEYFEEVLNSLRPQWKHTKMAVNTDFHQKLEIVTYPGVLAQILTNLISNSIHHAYAGDQQQGTIELKLKRESDTAFIYYDDYGKGMDAETLDSVFDPFFTTRRGYGGTGLSMHIVYNLVTQKLHGQITCQSQPGKGCHIVIKLPIQIEGA